MALRYTGDTLNISGILISLSDKDILNNTYTLTESDFQQLRIISNITVIVTEQKHRLRNLITDGASIFAKDELISATSAINLYNEAIKNANGNIAAKLSTEIKAESR